MERAKYVQLLMKRGDKAPVAVFYFTCGDGVYRQDEITLDTTELAVMFDDAVMGLMPDVLTSAVGVSIQYNLDYAYRVKYVGK